MIKKTIATLLLGTTFAGGSLVAYDALAGQKLTNQVAIAEERIGIYENNETILTTKLNTLLGNANEKIEGANTKILSFLGVINSQSSEIQRLNNIIVNLNGELAQANSDKERLTNELAQANSDKERLTNELAQANNSIASLTNQLTQANNDINSLESQLTQANTVISTNANKLEKLNNENMPLTNKELNEIDSELKLNDVVE